MAEQRSKSATDEREQPPGATPPADHESTRRATPHQAPPPTHLAAGEQADAEARERGDLVIGDLPPLVAASQDHAAPPPDRPGAFYAQAGSYITSPLNLFASSVGIEVASYTFDSTTVAADANGNKLVNEGTTLSATAGGKAQPRTGTQTCIGVLDRRMNLRDGDHEIGLIVGGDLLTAMLTDNGTFGTVAASAVTDLAALGVRLKPYMV